MSDLNTPKRKAVMPYTLEKILEKLTMDQAFMICRYLDENPNAAVDMIETIVISHPDLIL
jgi:hypothetical protein